MEKYLYGAAVKGIQSFIFQTNELQDIVGASELVQLICTDSFNEFARNGKNIVRAAGNIKFLFNNREDCEKAVLEFPKKVMESAPGITISQAVVKFDEESTSFDKVIEELEKKLKIQRNKSVPSSIFGLTAMEHSRNTGQPVVDIKINKKKGKEEYWDDATKCKKEEFNKASNRLCQDAFGHSISPAKFPYDIKQITSNNDWIAVIHADGNGLGQIIQSICHEENLMINFSEGLSYSTKSAARQAYAFVRERYGIHEEDIIPIRPIVLSGDDFTVICRADFAIEYIQAFIIAFENETKLMLDSIFENREEKNIIEKLTCCAGITFMKSSFPFYYGYELAEALCAAAKIDAKSFDTTLSPSCLMFHKVQDSFITSYQDIVNRELTLENTDNNISWQFGPYYVDSLEGRWTIEDLLDCRRALSKKNGNVLKNNIRQWLSAMTSDTNYAEQILERAKVMAQDSFEVLSMATTPEITTKFGKKKKYYPAYDILSLNTISVQKTKEVRK